MCTLCLTIEPLLRARVCIARSNPEKVMLTRILGPPFYNVKTRFWLFLPQEPKNQKTSELSKTAPVHTGWNEGSQMSHMYGYVTYIHIPTWDPAAPLRGSVVALTNFSFLLHLLPPYIYIYTYIYIYIYIYIKIPKVGGGGKKVK